MAPMIDKQNAKNNASLPLIPLQPLLESSPATADIANGLLSAFQTEGFLYLTDFQSVIPPEMIEKVFTQSAGFFALPLKTKNVLEWSGPRANRGYSSLGQEKNSLASTKEGVGIEREEIGDDLKESFEIGREKEEGCPNLWPVNGWDEAFIFRSTMQDFFMRCKEIHKLLMRGVALAMGLNEAFFDGFVRTGDNTLRLLHYPEVAPGGFAGGKRVRAGAHSDYGSITLLFQDSRGGLQVEHPSGGWLNVAPIEGTIVVNAGDLLTRWTNDLIRSTKHQVVEPPSPRPDGGHPARYSIAYFCNPDFDRNIEVLPGTWEGEKGGKKYTSVNSGDYLVQRLSATY
ncbi:uncharacterized protein KY384_004891 [Bacidia gigantensis]|uniref:uncharacterized protein n=1 Tax=Bacidia gigantensis TaxID=2732470 RepID=UPI001D04A15B|nr:uncharacterized protein KY384_004891 [Bacidia gigantensis]KAG8530389.1 hypothetical protein KY384_004891 [Bacidia gigantensis]